MILDVAVGETIPIEWLSSDRDRLRVPVLAGVRDFLADGIPISYDPLTRSPRVVSEMTVMTFERTLDGWLRVE